MACKDGKCELSGRVRRLREAGMDALRAGEVEQAETLLRQSVDVSEAGGGINVVTAQSTFQLARVLHEAGRHDEAAEQFEKALALVRGRAGCGSRLYRTILGEFAQTLAVRACAVGE